MSRMRPPHRSGRVVTAGVHAPGVQRGKAFGRRPVIRGGAFRQGVAVHVKAKGRDRPLPGTDGFLVSLDPRVPPALGPALIRFAASAVQIRPKAGQPFAHVRHQRGIGSGGQRPLARFGHDIGRRHAHTPRRDSRIRPHAHGKAEIEQARHGQGRCAEFAPARLGMPMQITAKSRQARGQPGKASGQFGRKVGRRGGARHASSPVIVFFRTAFSCGLAPIICLRHFRPTRRTPPRLKIRPPSSRRQGFCTGGSGSAPGSGAR